MIRPIRPTDLPALASFYRSGFGNEARSAGYPGTGRRKDASIGVFLEQWLSLQENRHTWVHLEGRRITGLISAYGLVGNTAWEIDRLLLGTRADYAILGDLLDYISAVAAEVSVGRLFLRLLSDGATLDLARRAGFHQYVAESLYIRETPVRLAPPVLPNVRIRRHSAPDEWHAFRLYNSVVPGRVRQAEGMTLQEWRQARERVAGRRRRREFVADEQSQVIAWLQTGKLGPGGHFDVLTGEVSSETLTFLVRSCMVNLSGRSPLTCLVPEYQTRLAPVLEQEGFSRAANYASLVKQVAIRVRRPALVPARA